MVMPPMVAPSSTLNVSKKFRTAALAAYKAPIKNFRTQKILQSSAIKNLQIS
jgi:hypothetical protein